MAQYSYNRAVFMMCHYLPYDRLHYAAVPKVIFQLFVYPNARDVPVVDENLHCSVGSTDYYTEKSQSY